MIMLAYDPTTIDLIVISCIPISVVMLLVYIALYLFASESFKEGGYKIRKLDSLIIFGFLSSFLYWLSSFFGIVNDIFLYIAAIAIYISMADLPYVIHHLRQTTSERYKAANSQAWVWQTIILVICILFLFYVFHEDAGHVLF